MKFLKMHGLGNDFVLLNCEKEIPLNVADLTIRLCNRHKGIGADGLVLVTPSSDADIGMRIFNADGEEAEQCGNAIRCVAKYAIERLGIQKKELAIKTRRGVQLVWYQEDGQICVDMGPPILEAQSIPVNLPLEKVIQYPQKIENNVFRLTCVSMGNPHTVIEVADVQSTPVDIWGPQIETYPLFSNRTNVEFISIQSPKEVIMRVWERGVGITQACGSGACAAVVAGVLWEKLARTAVVHLDGGDLKITWDEKSNNVYMTGPATFVFEGEIPE